MASIQAINAAAKAIYEGYSDVRASWTTWSELDTEVQDYFRDLARAALDSVVDLISAEMKPETAAKCQTCGKPSVIRLNNEDMCADCHRAYWANQGVGTHTESEEQIVKHADGTVAVETGHVDIVPHFFRSCPACRGSGKLDLRCSICEGRGSVTTDPEGRVESGVTDGAKRLLEAARVAVLPTEEFDRMKANFQRETLEWGVRWLRMRAKNMAATQDYLGEHRLNQAADLLEKDFEEWQDGS